MASVPSAKYDTLRDALPTLKLLGGTVGYSTHVGADTLMVNGPSRRVLPITSSTGTPPSSELMYCALEESTIVPGVGLPALQGGIQTDPSTARSQLAELRKRFDVASLDVERFFVGVRVDRDRPDTEGAGGASDAAGDLAAVGDEQLSEHFAPPPESFARPRSTPVLGRGA